MKRTTKVLGVISGVFALSVFGCSSSSKDEMEVGTVEVGAYSIHVLQQGSPVSAGDTTRFILKATGGTPTSITGWIGLASAEGSVKKAAVYDSGDGDYDDDVVAPTPLASDARFWFEIDTNGDEVKGSIAYLK